MAQPTFDHVGDTFIFSNEHLTITAETEFVPPASVTVEQVTLTTPHDQFILPVTDVVVPPPVIEHHFDLLT
jgi:hypothetical protein